MSFYDFDNDFDIPAANIDALLEEASIARKESLNEEVHHDDAFKRKLSPAESNESDIYSTDADPVDSVELEEHPVEHAPSDTIREEEIAIHPTPTEEYQADKVVMPEPVISRVDQQLLDVDFTFPPMHSYNLFSEKQIDFINTIKIVIIKKFPSYTDFIICLNSFHPDYVMDARCFLFFHLIYTLDNPVDFIYLLGFDPLNNSPLVDTPCNEILDLWRYIRKY